MATDNKQYAYDYLVDLATQQGYVTFDNIFFATERWHLPLKDVDWLSSSISTIGILVYDEAPTIANTEDNDEDFNDYAQSDYDELYSTVIELEPDLEPLVNDIKRVRPAQYKEIPRLIMQAQDGNFHARERLIEIHLRSALRIAFQRAILFDEDISECFGNACVGVVTAIDKYDSRKNGPIGSYVSMWVLQTMMREQSPKCNLYFPVHKREPYFLVYPALKAYGCTQCAKLLECKKARSIVKEELDFFYEESEITDVLVQASTFMSLEEISEIGGDVDDLFYEYDYFIDNTDLLAVTNERKQIISKSLSQLSDRERYVILRRFGFYGYEPMTLEEVAKGLDLTRERIRQIEFKAIRNLFRSAVFRRIYDGNYEFNKAVPIKETTKNEPVYSRPTTALADAFPPSRFGLFLSYCYNHNVLNVGDLTKTIIDGFLSTVNNSKSKKLELFKVLVKYKMEYLVM